MKEVFIMVHTHKHWISIFMGLFIGILSIPPLLAQFGLISLSLPAFLETFTLRFMYFILLIGALYLLIDSSHEIGTLQALSILIGIVVGIIALVHILIYFNIIAFSNCPAMLPVPNCRGRHVESCGNIFLIQSKSHPASP